MRKVIGINFLGCMLISFVAVTGQAASGSAGSFPAGVQKICFSRGQNAYVLNAAEKTPQRIVKGTDPEISPKGDAVAFTYNYTDQRPADRTIKIMQLATKQITEFPSLAKLISYGPQWSPDGTKIAFHGLIKDKWQVGILQLANGTWETLPTSLSNDAFLSSWASDTSVLIQDLENVYEITLDGQIVRQFPIADLLAKVSEEQGLTSNSRFSLSPDRRSILFDTTGGPDGYDRIWLFDVAQHTFSSVTPEKMNVTEPHWLPSGQEILFTSWQGQDRFDLLKIGIDGTHPTTIIKNALNVSYSPY